MVTVAQHTWVLIHESYEGQQIGRFSQLHSQITYPNIQHDRNMERKWPGACNQTAKPKRMKKLKKILKAKMLKFWNKATPKDPNGDKLVEFTVFVVI